MPNECVRMGMKKLLGILQSLLINEITGTYFVICRIQIEMMCIIKTLNGQHSCPELLHNISINTTLKNFE